MKAVAFRSHGGPEVLEQLALPVPALGASSVRVRVRAVALNHLDLWVRRGFPALEVAFPHVLGSDVAGVVDAVGAEVSDLAPGTEVVIAPGLSCGHCPRCARGQDHQCRQYRVIGEHLAGGYAEFVTVPRANLLPKPRRLGFAEAACIPLTFLTAWTMLVRRAQLEPGETVLVHAANSGVGSAGIQIAKVLGATVIATARGEAKVAKARELGADHVIDTSTQDFLSEVKRITERRLVDVVFEHIGGETFEKSIACLPRGGRLVTCGATSGHDVEVDLRALFYKRISLLGSTMGSRGDLFRILELVEQGKLRPVVDRVLPLEQAAEAHRILEARMQFGNLVLTP